MYSFGFCINFFLLCTTHSSPNQVVRALDVVYELLRRSPPREHVQAVLLEWGVEQLYCLLLTPTFGDEARERVFRVRKIERTLVAQQIFGCSLCM